MEDTVQIINRVIDEKVNLILQYYSDYYMGPFSLLYDMVKTATNASKYDIVKCIIKKCSYNGMVPSETERHIFLAYTYLVGRDFVKGVLEEVKNGQYTSDTKSTRDY